MSIKFVVIGPMYLDIFDEDEPYNPDEHDEFLGEGGTIEEAINDAGLDGDGEFDPKYHKVCELIPLRVEMKKKTVRTTRTKLVPVVVPL